MRAMRSSLLAPMLAAATLIPAAAPKAQGPETGTPEAVTPTPPIQIGPGGPTLEQVLEIARRRAAAQRAQVEEKLAPFLVDLRLDYRGSRDHLQKRFDLIAEIGDPVVPVLIDFLAPEPPVDGGERNIARNAARVLGQMDLQGHRPALIDLLEGESATGRALAIPLCGRAGGDECAQAILRVFPTLTEENQIVDAIDADRAIGQMLLKQTAVTLIDNPSEDVRSAALRHVIAAGDEAAVPALIKALPTERERRLLSLHVEAFSKLAKRNGQAAEALLPLLRPGDRQLDSSRREVLAQAIGSIAPGSDKEVGLVLDEMVETEGEFEIALAAAKGLEALGDRRAQKKITERAEAAIRKNNTSARAFEDLADAYGAFDEARKAVGAYERALRYGSQNSLIRRRVNLKVAHLQAELENTNKFLQAIEAAGLGRDDIETEAEKDPAFAKMLDRDRVARYVRRLTR